MIFASQGSPAICPCHTMIRCRNHTRAPALCGSKLLSSGERRGIQVGGRSPVAHWGQRHQRLQRRGRDATADPSKFLRPELVEHLLLLSGPNSAALQRCPAESLCLPITADPVDKEPFWIRGGLALELVDVEHELHRSSCRSGSPNGCIPSPAIAVCEPTSEPKISKRASRPRKSCRC